MNIENFNVGEKHNLKLLCIHCEEKVVVFETPTGLHIPLRDGDIECITPENGTKNSDPAPKYDPCRMFKEGDIVAPQEVNGRIFSGAVEELIGQNCVVVEDELVCCNVRIRHGEDEYTIDPAYLELVTPVEELKPYCIADHIHGWIVYKDNPGNVVANFNKTHPHAKAAAKAECERLNAEHRKEQSND